MTSALEDLALAEAVLLTDPQTMNGWAALHFLRHARETLVRDAVRVVVANAQPSTTQP